MKFGIVIDRWKLSIFDRHLAAAGFTYSLESIRTSYPPSLLLTVHTEEKDTLTRVFTTASDEAVKQRNLGHN